eukprot:9677209-Lingulodinium_polyedra.AAC.1
MASRRSRPPPGSPLRQGHGGRKVFGQAGGHPRGQPAFNGRVGSKRAAASCGDPLLQTARAVAERGL